MSLTQTYYVASTARTKLGREAARSDHDLRVLVGHANLLDTLMIDLADAEREQEAWFNNTVSNAGKSEEPKHIQWFDSIEEEMHEAEEDDSESEAESDVYDEDSDQDQFAIPLRRIRSPPVQVSSVEIDEEDLSDDEEDYEDYAYDEELTLKRVPSFHAPPELTHEESDSEDDSMPPSPEHQQFDYHNAKAAEAMLTTTFYDKPAEYAVHEQPPQRQAPMIASY